MKVGVLTFHKCINYGSYWQARCLVEWLKGRGHQVELMDHDCANVRYAEARCALQPKLPVRTPRHELKVYAAKARRFAEAVARLPLSRRFPLHEPSLAGRYDAIVVGSDEVWNFRHPWYGGKPIFFGDGLKAPRLVSYAASFGNHGASDGIHPVWAKKLRRFSAVSVRDQNSWRLVRSGTDRKPELVVDPCLLFPEPALVERPSSARYALVYGYSFPDWLKSLARRWSERSGIKLVSVGYSNDFADEQRISDGPVEFAQLIAGSSAVLTNFFHGCVFALLNGKPWATVPSDYRSIKIPDLASRFGADHRLVDPATKDQDLSELLGTPVSGPVLSRIVELRARSEAYLSEALA